MKGEVRLRTWIQEIAPAGNEVDSLRCEYHLIEERGMTNEMIESLMVTFLAAHGQQHGDYWYPGILDMGGTTYDGGRTWLRGYGWRPGRVY